MVVDPSTLQGRLDTQTFDPQQVHDAAAAYCNSLDQDSKTFLGPVFAIDFQRHDISDQAAMQIADGASLPQHPGGYSSIQRRYVHPEQRPQYVARFEAICRQYFPAFVPAKDQQTYNAASLVSIKETRDQNRGYQQSGRRQSSRP